MLLKNTFLMDWLECKEKIQMEKKKKELPRATECVHIHWAVLPEKYVIAPKPHRVGGAVLWETDLE